MGIGHEETLLVGQSIESQFLAETLLPIGGAIPKAVVHDDQGMGRGRIISGRHVQNVLPHQRFSAHLLGDGPVARMGAVEGADRVGCGLGESEERRSQSKEGQGNLHMTKIK